MDFVQLTGEDQFWIRCQAEEKDQDLNEFIEQQRGQDLHVLAQQIARDNKVSPDTLADVVSQHRKLGLQVPNEAMRKV